MVRSPQSVFYTDQFEFNVFAKSKGKEKEEKRREQELTGEELAKRLCIIFFLFVCLFLLDFWLRNVAGWQKVVANHHFQKYDLLELSLTGFCWRVKGLITVSGSGLTWWL